MNIISIKEHIVDTDVVNDITCTRQSVYACGHTIFMTRRYPLNNWATSYDKNDFKIRPEHQNETR